MNILPFLDELLSVSDDLIWITRETPGAARPRHIFWCNRNIERLTGYSRDEFMEASPLLLCGAETDMARIRQAQEDMKGGEPGRFQVTQYRKDGSSYWADTIIQPWKNAEDDTLYFLSIQRDISELRDERLRVRRGKAENRLLRQQMNRSEKYLHDVLDAIGDGVIIYDENDRIKFLNSAVKKLLGPMADFIMPGTEYRELYERGIEHGIFDPGDIPKDRWIKMQRDLRLNPSSENNVSRSHGGRYVKRNDTRLPNGDFFGLRVDVTELIEQQKELEDVTSQLRLAQAAQEYLYTHDNLTGIANRVGAEQRLTDLSEEIRAKTPVSVIHIALDDFRRVNDTLGHKTGDTMLRMTADALNRLAGEDDFCARIGGDEYLIILNRATGQDELEDLGDRVLKTLQEPVEIDGHRVKTAASIGIVTHERAGFDPDRILVEADIAVSRAKEDGGNQTRFFSVALHAEVIRKKQTADQILTALESRQFVPWFQPQFCAKTGRFSGVEALARWDHPARGVLSPAHFIAVASELDVVHEIDTMIFEKSLEIMEEFQADGVVIPKFSVNVSFSRLKDFQDRLTKDLSGNYDGQIAFELVETIFFDDVVDDFSGVISEIRAQGIDIELDDFGTGHASLLGLMKLLPDAVKLDRQLVAPISTSAYVRKTVESIVGICHSTGAKVTAEGAETSVEVEALREIGCDVIQGYGLAKPMSAEDLFTFALGESDRDTVQRAG